MNPRHLPWRSWFPHPGLQRGVLALAQNLGCPDPPGFWTTLVQAHQAPGRHYHTLNHLALMHRFLILRRDFAPDFPVLFLGILFHDWVYDPARKDNEEASAQTAAQILHSWPGAQVRIPQVQQLIRATAGHEASEALTGFFLDLDLAVLASPRGLFRRYTQQVRREYQTLYNPGEFNQGRHKFLQTFLAKPRIFQDPLWAEVLEPRARKNLLWEKEFLEKILEKSPFVN